MANLGKFGGSDLMEPSDDFSPIPAGPYDVEVTESDVVSTKAGDGTMVNLTLRVIGGAFEGRLIWARLNIENRSEKAQDIGQRQLSDLARACGFAAIPDSTEKFHGIPIRVNVKVKPGDGEYGPKNEVNGFKAAASHQPAARPTAAPQRQAPARPTGGGAPPSTGGAKPSWMTRRAG